MSRLHLNALLRRPYDFNTQRTINKIYNINRINEVTSSIVALPVASRRCI